MEDDLIPGDDIHVEPVQQGPRRRRRPLVDTLQGHPYLEFPDDTEAARHCQKLRRMYIGSHAAIDWEPRVRRFIPVDSPWHRLLIWRTRRAIGSCWSSSFRHSHFTLLGPSAAPAPRCSPSA
ncbi:hypothetical protein Hdeb2414_s0006g00224951 [Helianthus debilis subsp. tardiflorus]